MIRVMIVIVMAVVVLGMGGGRGYGPEGRVGCGEGGGVVRAGVPGRDAGRGGGLWCTPLTHTKHHKMLISPRTGQAEFPFRPPSPEM